MFMQNTVSVVLKILKPTRRKAMWLESTAAAFSAAVELGLSTARAEHTSSRATIHKASYRDIRQRFGLPADYARMAVNAAVSLARSYYGQRRSRHFRRTSFPKLNGSQGIGLGVNAYKVVRSNNRTVLRVSTGKRGQYIWLPLCVPDKYRDKVLNAHGDAKIFKRGSDWYVMLPIRTSPAPTVRDGEHTFIGVDLGIVRLATVSTPNGVIHFNGKAVRHRREHFADLRRRYQQHNRLDRVKAQKGKESRWMRNVNHKLSRQIIDIALQYDSPVIVLEALDGIRNRTGGSKRFNRMMASWAFRQLINFIQYKAEHEAIPVIFVDPRGTSSTCPRCGHKSRSNRPTQSQFRCAACGYRANADAVAAINIARRGLEVYGDGLSDTARSNDQTGGIGPQPDGVNGFALHN